MIALDQLSLTGMQLRAERQRDAVGDYAERYRQHGATALPPIDVFRDVTVFGEVKHWLADGHHRISAARKAGLAELPATIHTGDKRAAILFAAQANARHGAQLTAADKRAIVDRILADEEWRAWADARIADHCHVSAALVAKRRKATGAIAAVREGKDGKTRRAPQKPQEEPGQTALHVEPPAAEEPPPAPSAPLDPPASVLDAPAPPRPEPTPAERIERATRRRLAEALRRASQSPHACARLLFADLDRAARLIMRHAHAVASTDWAHASPPADELAVRLALALADALSAFVAPATRRLIAEAYGIDLETITHEAHHEVHG